ncbi:MAG: hypothetical protein ACR2NO_04750 [Chloroflexota bacterium]
MSSADLSEPETMSDLEKILLNSAITIAGAVLVYVIGQMLSKLFIEPAHELRKVIGEVRFNLAFHAPTIHTPIGRSEVGSEEARKALMKSSCDLLAKVHAIPCYDALSRLSSGFLPPRGAIEDAAVRLRGLSTYMHETGDKAQESIEALRKIVASIEAKLGLKPLA